MKVSGETTDLYIDTSKLLNWVQPNTPIFNLLNEGAVNNVYVRTTTGWVNITKSTITKAPK